jgi:Fic family protein
MSPEPTYRPFPPFADWAKLPVELKYWQRALAELKEFRQKASPAVVEEAARFVTRATAVDTAAIEGLYPVNRGFTLSVAAQAGAWEQDFDEKGLDARGHFEAQLRAFELVLDAATGEWPVIEAMIRALHEHVCAAQDTYKVWTSQGWQDHELTRGEYKRFPNNPQRKDRQEHAYAPVERVQEEMQRLVAELGSEVFVQAPAPIQAAYAHYAFVSIHPFADGNGRVARALASIYLIRATSVPFLIFADEKPAYLDALEAADRGSHRELVELIRDRSMGAMNYMSVSLQKALAPKAGEVRDASWRLFYATPEFTHEQVDNLAERLLEETGKAFQAAFEALDLPRELQIVLLPEQGDAEGPPNEYRRLGISKPPQLIVRVESLPPAFGRVGAQLRPLVARDWENPSRVRIEVRRRGERFDASTDELYPEFSLSLRARLRLWSEALVASLVDETIRQVAQSREEGGWRK